MNGGWGIGQGGILHMGGWNNDFNDSSIVYWLFTQAFFFHSLE
jgi:hypothetical protein